MYMFSIYITLIAIQGENIFGKKKTDGLEKGRRIIVCIYLQRVKYTDVNKQNI